MPSSGVQTCALDRKSTRLNSSHGSISYAVFCLEKKRFTHGFETFMQWLKTGFQSRTRLESLEKGLSSYGFSFFFNDTATTEIYTLSLHDALPISPTAVPIGANRDTIAPAVAWTASM